MNDLDALNLGLLIIRVALGAMLFAHGWRHLKSLRSGPGMANWFESLGIRNGPLQAATVTYTELAAGAALVVGFLTPASYGGMASILFVAMVTNHWKNGFFLDSKKEGWEYVGISGAVAVGMSAVGPGQWSLDDAFGFHFPFDPGTGLLIGVLIGVVGTAAFLATFWRPKSVAKGV